MEMYLRFTENAADDLIRATSYHTLYDSEVEHYSELYDTRAIEGKSDESGNLIIKHEGSDLGFATVIGGLCGYWLQSENLEDAILEVKQMGTLPYGDLARHNWTIFEGIDPKINNVFGDGDIFTPVSILYSQLITIS